MHLLQRLQFLKIVQFHNYPFQNWGILFDNAALMELFLVLTGRNHRSMLG